MCIGLISMVTGSGDLEDMKAVGRRQHERGRNTLAGPARRSIERLSGSHASDGTRYLDLAGRLAQDLP